MYSPEFLRLIASALAAIGAGLMVAPIASAISAIAQAIQ